jgi:hypothetical protein
MLRHMNSRYVTAWTQAIPEGSGQTADRGVHSGTSVTGHLIDFRAPTTRRDTDRTELDVVMDHPDGS